MSGPPFEIRREQLEAVLAEAAFVLERSEVPADSIPSRRDLEWLVVARRPKR